MKRHGCAALAVAVAALLGGGARAESLEGTAAVLQGLDKVTARVSRFEAPVGQTVGFNRLRITVRACRKRPPEEPPESAAFLEIDDVQPNGEVKRVYSGWMFASSPAVAAMEHPVYDVWVLDCRVAEAPPPTPPAPPRR
ncbi:DUF2155 domain-containing protein [Desertibaculum subflavum]|uniref:DUF2155 domain-containing protein n=1 Tax=Desertibaculum subflavum TaxID=2268458 RepID=UPI000E6751F5